MPETGKYTDPYRNYNFKLSIQGVTEAHFKECSDMAVNVDVIDFREAGANQVVHRIPGQTNYGHVSLRYGLSASKELWNWMLSAVKGKVQRKRASIIILDADGHTEHTRWNLNNAWVCEWRAAPLDATGHEIAIESITLTFETLERD